MRTISSLLVLALVTSFMIGCATTEKNVVESLQPPAQPTQQVEQPQPLKLDPSGSKPLAFYRLMFLTPIAADIVAAEYENLLEEKTFPYVGTEEFSFIASQELRSYGYTILGMESLLFNDNDWDLARYQLGGTVTSLDVHGVEGDSDSYEADLTATWQLYDAVEKQVLYEETTTGTGEKATLVAATVFAAFKTALHNLMASKPFVAKVEKPAEPEQQVTTTWEASPINVSCDASTSYSLPGDLEKVQEAVVTISPSTSFGSGVIVSSDGHVLTAEHVVSGRAEVQVELKSGLKLTARVERSDKLQDVALLRLPGKGYRCLSVQLDQEPALGAEVYVIGTPWAQELARTVSKGVVSGYPQLEHKAKFIQTDAATNFGNSGGPLVDHEGQVIGIAARKVAEEGHEGLSFGVPMPVVAKRLGISQ